MGGAHFDWSLSVPRVVRHTRHHCSPNFGSETLRAVEHTASKARLQAGLSVGIEQSAPTTRLVGYMRGKRLLAHTPKDSKSDSSICSHTCMSSYPRWPLLLETKSPPVSGPLLYAGELHRAGVQTPRVKGWVQDGQAR